MPLQPTSALVAAAWIRLAVPDVGGVGRRLPAADDAMRAGGFIRTQVVGGSPELYVPMHRAVAVCECWWPPLTDDSHLPPWNRAGQLGQRLVTGTWDPALTGVTVDPTPPESPAGSYSPARVHTVAALDVPQEVLDDPAHYARADVRLAITWSPVA